MTPTRSTAEERREEIVAAAAVEFAHNGYAGTSTEAIARRVGVSQPYLFQLFGTKKELFIAAVRYCFARVRRTFEDSGRAARAEGLATHEVMMRMGDAYATLLVDREILRMQLQAYAACGDPEIQAVVRENMIGLWQLVEGLTGASRLELHGWFAEGMLINLLATIDDSARSPEEYENAVLGAGRMKC